MLSVMSESGRGSLTPAFVFIPPFPNRMLSFALGWITTSDPGWLLRFTMISISATSPTWLSVPSWGFGPGLNSSGVEMSTWLL